MATVKGAVCKIDLLTLNLVSQSKFKIYLSGCQTPAGVLLWKARLFAQFYVCNVFVDCKLQRGLFIPQSVHFGGCVHQRSHLSKCDNWNQAVNKPYWVNWQWQDHTDQNTKQIWTFKSI